MAAVTQKNKSITSVVKDDLCTGCGTCVALCPLGAISMHIDTHKGIYLPRLAPERCNQCGVCYNTCPGHSTDLGQVNNQLGDSIISYTGHAADREIRYNASSGGLVTSVLVFALEKGLIDGALVTGMKEKNPLEPLPFIAKTPEEVLSAAGTKYCPVPANIVLKEILEKEGRYAVVGLPCHLQGIRKAEKINSALRNRIILHLGIFCSGMPSFNATQYMLHRLKVNSKDVKALKYRGEGWPGKMALKLKNGDTKLIPYPSYWAGFGTLFFPRRCMMCADWFAKLADISMGDAWLPELKQDNIGSSVIIARSTQGDDILRKMVQADKLELSVVGTDKVKDSQGGFPERKEGFKAHLAISKIFNSKKPIIYENIKYLPSPRSYAYFKNSVIYIMHTIAARRYLWWLVDIFLIVSRKYWKKD